MYNNYFLLLVLLYKLDLIDSDEFIEAQYNIPISAQDLETEYKIRPIPLTRV